MGINDIHNIIFLTIIYLIGSFGNVIFYSYNEDKYNDNAAIILFFIWPIINILKILFFIILIIPREIGFWLKKYKQTEK